MEEESNNVGFQYVIGKKRSNQKRRRGKREKQEDEEEEEKKGGKLLARRLEIIASKRTLLLTGNLGREIESFLDNVFSFINEGEEIPCSILTLGLGSIKDSKAAQVQLAFLLIVRDKLSHLLSQDGGDSRQDRIEVQAYDPIFNQEDHELLSALDITTTDDNLQGCYVLKQATFVFMPHCTKTLYENILRSNWTPTGLKHLWLCCNELERYVNGRSSDLMIPCIKRIGKISSWRKDTFFFSLKRLH